MKYIVRIIWAALLAFLLGGLFALIAEQGKAGDLFAFFFLISLAVYSFLLLRSAAGKVLFRFSLIFGIEWLLLPIAAGINANQAGTFGGAIGAGLILALSVPVGLVIGLLFLALAFFKFRPKRGHVDEG